jgi:flagellar hook assembly protein FlgD
VLPQEGHADLSVFDARGKLVVNLVDRVLGAGLEEFTWNGKGARGESMSSGVYFYRLEVGKRVLTRKMVLIK